jgi:N-acetylmuramoyl-L-alanine amidase
MKIALDIGHIGRTGKRAGDLGASHGSLHEADLVWRIVEGAWKALRDEHEVFILSHGSYASRHQWCNQHGVGIFLAGHINSFDKPGPGYGAFFYDPRTRSGDKLAACLAREMMALAHGGIPTKTKSKTKKWPAYEAKGIKAAGDVWKNARFTIAGLRRPIGICCEPFFISNAENRKAFAHSNALLAVGQAYARGINSFLNRNSSSPTTERLS